MGGMMHILLVILIILLICLILMIPGRPVKDDALIFAHRGLHDIENGIPENSMAAFKRAMEENAGIELDLHMTKDGKVVVFHDDGLERITGIEGKIVDKNWNEIKDLKLSGTEEKIPLLTDVLSLVDGKVDLLIEFKTERDPKRLCEAADEILKSYKGRYFMQSFDPRCVRWYRKNRKDIKRGILCEAFNKHGTKINHFMEFTLRSMFLNTFTKPNFISYNIEDAKRSIAFLICKFLYRARSAYWVIRNDSFMDELLRKKNIVIFEKERPA